MGPNVRSEEKWDLEHQAESDQGHLEQEPDQVDTAEAMVIVEVGSDKTLLADAGLVMEALDRLG